MEIKPARTHRQSVYYDSKTCVNILLLLSDTFRKLARAFARYLGPSLSTVVRLCAEIGPNPGEARRIRYQSGLVQPGLG